MATIEATNSLSSIFSRATSTAHHLQELLPPSIQAPRIAIVCGSGLGGLADTVSDSPRLEVPYASIPEFPRPTVQGHAGKLVFGVMGSSGVPVVCLVGRAHFYEGHTMEIVTFATRVCKIMGVETMIGMNIIIPAKYFLRPKLS